MYLHILVMCLVALPIHCDGVDNSTSTKDSSTGGRSQTFLAVALTVVITGFIILLMIIFALLLIQRRTTKVCYVQRTPEVITTDRNRNPTLKNITNITEIYDESFLDQVTLQRWQSKRSEMRANTPSIRSTNSSRVVTQVDITDGLKTGLKRPSNGTILPVTYLGILQEESGASGSRMDRRDSTPGVQEYVCY
uniref:Cnidarian restricted protein n=1 Tax=Clytia hemisphaerica TaxID=252671 RepID=A0A7M6DQQ9_9CNID